MPEELWMEVSDIIQEAVIKTIPKKKKCKKAKWLSEEALQIAMKTREGQRLTVLSTEHTDHSKHPFPTTQETTLHPDITRWSILKSY